MRGHTSVSNNQNANNFIYTEEKDLTIGCHPQAVDSPYPSKALHANSNVTRSRCSEHNTSVLPLPQIPDQPQAPNEVLLRKSWETEELTAK